MKKNKKTDKIRYFPHLNELKAKCIKAKKTGRKTTVIIHYHGQVPAGTMLLFCHTPKVTCTALTWDAKTQTTLCEVKANEVLHAIHQGGLKHTSQKAVTSTQHPVMTDQQTKEAPNTPPRTKPSQTNTQQTVKRRRVNIPNQPRNL